MIFENDNISYILNNLIRVGKVSSINEKEATARVIFSGQDEAVSYDLPIIQRNTLNNKDYALPDVGEQVVCIFLPNGIQQGFVLGSIYSQKDLPVVKDKDRRHVKFSDGTEIEYDRKEHVLKVKCIGKVIIDATEGVYINGQTIV